jgi:RNA polymerase sigma-70 factor (TIGR02943 family)
MTPNATYADAVVALRPMLVRVARQKLRNEAWAEDAVSEALVAALENPAAHAGRASLRTWLVGILKHKIVDQLRRSSRERVVDDVEGDAFEHDEFFRPAGEWVEHWEPRHAPVEWRATPEALFERGEFWKVFEQCLSPLPARTATAFTLREVDGFASDEVCEILMISASNLWVMLHRARLHLRNCVEVNWFGREGSGD